MSANDYFERGNKKITACDLEGAIEDYSKSIEIEPKQSNVYYFRGLAKKESGQLNSAREDFFEAAILNHKDAIEKLKNTYPEIELSIYEIDILENGFCN